MIAYHIYADNFQTDLVMTHYLRAGCLIKGPEIINHRHDNGEEQKSCELLNTVSKFLVKPKQLVL